MLKPLNSPLLCSSVEMAKLFKTLKGHYTRCLVSPYAQWPVDYRSNCDEPLCLKVTTRHVLALLLRRQRGLSN